MPPYHYFIQPILNTQAQVAIMALCVLAAMDVLFGVLNAWFVQHDFSTHEFRQGLIRKLSNFGVVCAADVVDAMLLGGLELGFQPVLMAVCVSLILMELGSLMEIFAEMHPEISESTWWQMLAHSKDSLHKGGE
jgi:toxin secretion/phage lysis holin